SMLVVNKGLPDVTHVLLQKDHATTLAAHPHLLSTPTPCRPQTFDSFVFPTGTVIQTVGNATPPKPSGSVSQDGEPTVPEYLTLQFARLAEIAIGENTPQTQGIMLPASFLTQPSSEALDPAERLAIETNSWIFVAGEQHNPQSNDCFWYYASPKLVNDSWDSTKAMIKKFRDTVQALLAYNKNKVQEELQALNMKYRSAIDGTRRMEEEKIAAIEDVQHAEVEKLAALEEAWHIEAERAAAQRRKGWPHLTRPDKPKRNFKRRWQTWTLF
ncbi:hypothetical protein H0H81_005439, partial [Sphagnurus paluster]